MNYQFDAAHALGTFFKIAVAAIIFAFAVVLEYSFFLSISPPDKPWFPYLAMGLTAGGFVGWMFSFRLIRHHPLHTIIAFLMMIGCAVASLVVAGTEFYSWIAEHYNIVTNPAMYQQVTSMLLVIFCGHVVALLVDVSCGHFAKNPFRGNMIPQNYQQTGYYVEEQRGEPARPLASHRAMPKEAPANLDSTGQIETPQIEQPKPRELKPLPRMKTSRQVSQNPERGFLSEGVSLLTRRAKTTISNGRLVARAHGKTNETTSTNS